MTAQLDLFAPEIETITVEPTREVVARGVNAAEVPRHEHIPMPRPKSLQSDEDWLLALLLAEGQIRWRSWTQPRPPLDERPYDCADAKGVAVGGERRYATWPVLLRGLRDQREREPHIAAARDLAHAYHALERYDYFYVRDGGTVASNEYGWRERVAIPYLAKLQQTIIALGGDPESRLT